MAGCLVLCLMKKNVKIEFCSMEFQPLTFHYQTNEFSNKKGNLAIEKEATEIVLSLLKQMNDC
uniref:Uncharacterized protein n=1 Tax=Romanomermis culicivorax TaxID=13658 RepID=A0A915IZT1_ROMCU